MQHLDHSIDHSNHDVTLIAGHAAGDLVDSERSRAQALADTCGSCAELQRDLVAIAAATRSLPTLATATAPRDFRLAPEQAARLRRGSWLRTVLAPFGAARSATRPLAAAFTSLGLAGLLVATVLPGLFGAAASLTPEGARDATGYEQPTFGATNAPVAPGAGGPGQAAAPTPFRDYSVDSHSSGDPEGGVTGIKGAPTPSSTATSSATQAAVAGGGKTASAGEPGTVGESSDATGRASGTTPSTILLTGSLALLAVGLLLFALHIGARRLRI